ncbi:unnamed protein product [Orchesella dallaii]|uniref:F-box domain-containing protein n=1 Tax=Orchesella dallaii TaxID=48710 RepID=A0ABP1PIH8_9HEXA
METLVKSPPTEQVKVMENVEEKEDSLVVAADLVQVPNQVVLKSPKTEPVLPPQVWDKVFKYLPRVDLYQLMNTCPEWNALLESKKGEVLFPKVLACIGNQLPLKTALICRLVSKRCNAGIAEGRPEMIERIRRPLLLQHFGERRQVLLLREAMIMGERIRVESRLQEVRETLGSVEMYLRDVERV